MDLSLTFNFLGKCRFRIRCELVGECRKLFHSASPAYVGEMVFVLESEFSATLRNEKLRDIMLLVFCKPVPPELKVDRTTHFRCSH